MSVHTSIHRCRWAVAAALLLCGIARAQAQNYPVKPALEVPYTSLFGTAYTADTRPPATVVAAAKGDAESGLVVLHVCHFEDEYDSHYEGITNHSLLVFDWNYRTGKTSYVSTITSPGANGVPRTVTTADPSGIWPGVLDYYCSKGGGSWTTRQTVKTRCALVHVLTRPAKSAVHAWNPVNVGAAFATTQVLFDCNPDNRKDRVLTVTATIPRNGTHEFDLASVGFRNERSRSDGAWAVYFNQPSPTNANAPLK